MDSIDRTFVLVFARHRRKYVGSPIEGVWQKATYEFSGFLVLPWAAIAIILLVILHTLTARGFSPSDQLERIIKYAGIASLFLFIIYLDRRFRKYLLMPPPLPNSETTEEAKRIRKFRIGGLISFAIALGVAFLVHNIEGAY